MTRFGLSDDEDILSPSPSIYFCEGSSVDHIKSEQRHKDFIRLQETLQLRRERARRAGDEKVQLLEEQYAIHAASFSPKRMEETKRPARVKPVLTKTTTTTSTSPLKVQDTPRPTVPQVPRTPYPPLAEKADAATPNFGQLLKDSNTAVSRLSWSSGSITAQPPHTPFTPAMPNNAFSSATFSFSSSSKGGVAMSTPMNKLTLPLFEPPVTEVKKLVPPTLVEDSEDEESVVDVKAFKPALPALAVSVKACAQEPDHLLSQPQASEVDSTAFGKENKEIRPKVFDLPVRTALPEAPATHNISAVKESEIDKFDLPESFAAIFEKQLASKRYVDEVVKRYETRCSASVRSHIKRTIIETITVNTKRHASVADVKSTAMYLSQLFLGELLSGRNGESIQLSGSDDKDYAMWITVDKYLKLVEQDIDLCQVVARTIVLIVSKCIPFADIVIGKLLQSSVLLSMNLEACAEQCEWLAKQSSDASTLFIMQQRAAVRLFFLIHVAAIEWKSASFPLSNVWRCAALCVNRTVALATPFLLAELLKTCGPALSKHYGRQMKKLVGCIQKNLLNLLDDELQKNVTWQRSGVAVHVSVLRNAVDAFQFH